MIKVRFKRLKFLKELPNNNLKIDTNITEPFCLTMTSTHYKTGHVTRRGAQNKQIGHFLSVCFSKIAHSQL